MKPVVPFGDLLVENFASGKSSGTGVPQLHGMNHMFQSVDQG